MKFLIIGGVMALIAVAVVFLMLGIRMGLRSNLTGELRKLGITKDHIRRANEVCEALTAIIAAPLSTDLTEVPYIPAPLRKQAVEAVNNYRKENTSL